MVFDLLQRIIQSIFRGVDTIPFVQVWVLPTISDVRRTTFTFSDTHNFKSDGHSLLMSDTEGRIHNYFKTSIFEILTKCDIFRTCIA